MFLKLKPSKIFLLALVPTLFISQPSFSQAKQIDNEQIVIKSTLIKRGSTKRKSAQLHRKSV